MSNTVIEVSYTPGGYEKLMEATRKNRESYCNRHGYDYVEKLDDSYPRISMELVKDLLRKYEYLVTIDADILIQKPELSIQTLCTGPYVTYKEWSYNNNFIPFEDGVVPFISGGLSTLQPWILNGGFIVWHRELLNMPWFFEEFIHSPKFHNFRTTQDYLSHLMNIGAKFFGTIPKLQIAPKFYNPHLKYGDIDESEYFCLHFHQPTIVPHVDTKLAAVLKCLEDRPELSQ